MPLVALHRYWAEGVQPFDIAALLVNSQGASVTPCEAVPLGQASLNAWLQAGEEASAAGADDDLSLPSICEETCLGMVLPVDKYIDLEQGCVSNSGAGRVLQLFLLARHLLLTSAIGHMLRPVTVRLTKHRWSGAQHYDDSGNTTGYALLVVANSVLAEPYRVHSIKNRLHIVSLAEAQHMAAEAAGNGPAAGDDDDDDDDDPNGLMDVLADDLCISSDDEDGVAAAAAASGKKKKKKKKSKKGAAKKPKAYGIFTAVDFRQQFDHYVSVAAQFLNNTVDRRRQNPIGADERVGRVPRGNLAQQVAQIDDSIGRVVDPARMAAVALSGDTRAGGQSAPLLRVVTDVMVVLAPQCPGDDQPPSYWFRWEALTQTLLQHWGRDLAQQYLTEWYELAPVGMQSLPMQDVFILARVAGYYQNSVLALLPNNSRGLRLSTLQANLPYVANAVNTKAYPLALRQLLQQRSGVIDAWCQGKTASAVAESSSGDVSLLMEPEPETEVFRRNSATLTEALAPVPRVSLPDPGTFFWSLLLHGMDPSYSVDLGFGPPPLKAGPGMDEAQLERVKGEIVTEMQEMLTAVVEHPVLRRGVLASRPETGNQHAEFASRLTHFPPGTVPSLATIHGVRVLTDYLCAARDYAVANRSYICVSDNLHEQWAALRDLATRTKSISSVLAGLSMHEVCELVGQAIFLEIKPHTSTGYSYDAPVTLLMGFLSVDSRLNGKVPLHGNKAGSQASGKGTNDAIVGHLQRMLTRRFTPQGMNDLLQCQPGAVATIPEMPAGVMVPVSAPSMNSTDLRHSMNSVFEGIEVNPTRAAVFDNTATSDDGASKRKGPASNVFSCSLNYAGLIPDKAVWSRMYTQLLGSHGLLTQWNRVFKHARNHAEAVKMLFHVGQAIAQLLGGAFDHDVLPMASAIDMWVGALLHEATDAWAHRTFSRSHFNVDNRVRSNMTMATHQMTWSTSVHVGLRLALDQGIIDLETTSAEAVTYVVAAYAQAFHHRVQAGAVFSVLDQYLETLAGESVLDRILCAVREPGHSLSLINEKLTGVVSSVDVDEATLRTEMGSESWERAVGPLGDTAWPLALCHAIRTVGVTRAHSRVAASSTTDNDDYGDDYGAPRNDRPNSGRPIPQRVLVLRPSTIAHSYTVQHRAILCELLHSTRTVCPRNPKNSLDELCRDHAVALECLQARPLPVVEQSPLAVCVKHDPDEVVRPYLRRLGVDVPIDPFRPVVVKSRQCQALEAWLHSPGVDAEVTCTTGFELSSWRVAFLLCDKTFLDQVELQPEAVPALWSTLVLATTTVRVSELLARTPGLSRDWLIEVLRRMQLDPATVCVRDGTGEAGSMRLELTWELMQALRDSLRSRTGAASRDRTAIGELCTFGLGTLPLHVFPGSDAAGKQLRNVLKVMAELDRKRPEAMTLLPVRALGTHQISFARVRHAALDPGAMAVLSNLPPLEISLNEIRAGCNRRYGIAVTDQDVQRCLASARLLTLPGMGFSDDPNALSMTTGRPMVRIKPVIMAVLYASLCGSVVGMLASKKEAFENLVSDAVSIVTVRARDPLDWSRPASYAVPPHSQRLFELVRDPERLLCETRTARLFAGHEGWHASLDTAPLTLMREARERFRPVEAQMAQRAANGSDGNFGYVRVDRSTQAAGFYSERLAEFERNDLTSVQPRIKDHNHPGSQPSSPPAPADVRRFEHLAATPVAAVSGTRVALDLDLTVGTPPGGSDAESSDDEPLGETNVFAFV